MRIETKCVQAGYQPENGQPRILPIYQSTTYKYDSAEHLGKLFDLTVPGHMYTRISNPTVEMVEEKIAALEGGAGAMLTSSGQAANLLAVLNIASAGTTSSVPRPSTAAPSTSLPSRSSASASKRAFSPPKPRMRKFPPSSTGARGWCLAKRWPTRR